MLKQDHGYRWAVTELRQRQKTNKGAPAYSRFVNRPMGRHLAAVAYALGLTPNGVTWISALFTAVGLSVIALASPSIISSVLTAAALMIGYALDSADGQLARLRGGGSTAGEWLDHVVDAFKTVSLHVVVLICWYRFYSIQESWYLVPLAFVIVACSLFFAMILTDQLRRQRAGKQEHFLQGQGSSSALYSLAVLPTDYGLMCVLFSVLWWQPVFMTAYSLLLLATAGFLVLALNKWYREVKSFG
ncbi:CDP-alcohol phosphatidyltransferase family protein [Glutamicibacter sp. JC586]|uniref:CDP-alcohol phosphatidyltransferase family protein n=1 Tax=Glutamicibacter sp. JC586 TaxID=2590552 RepID=UPI00135C4811|nr:CDP-alcohol phosphatidyltransferase family protein [Glutamicibacter sp. JC586]